MRKRVEIINGKKICRTCKIVQPTENFYWIKRKEIFNSYCKKCESLRSKRYKPDKVKVAKRVREWIKNHPERHAEFMRKSQEKLKNDPKRLLRNALRRYKITGDDFNKMEISQQGKCAICLKSPEGFYKRLCVDHDHITNKVRGLLCHQCNFILGLSKENVKVLLSMIEYIKKYETKY
jgi:hypothetical protein